MVVSVQQTGIFGNSYIRVQKYEKFCISTENPYLYLVKRFKFVIIMALFTLFGHSRAAIPAYPTDTIVARDGRELTFTFFKHAAFAISAGATIRPVVSSIEQGFALPDVAEFEKLINPRTRGILICNPNNPTGYLYSRREMNRIRDLVKKYDLFLFSDEVYREFCYTGAPYISAFHLPGIEEQVVLIDSVSKRYNECGIRIGALITKHPSSRPTS